jgi:hypothetical protein
MCDQQSGSALKQKNREATTPRFSFEQSKQVQSDLLLDAGFALDAGFSLGAGVLVSDVEALFSAPGFAASPEAALPLVPLLALEVSVGGAIFFA